MATPVRVRFAPSPTGMLHIGGLRTALYNYLFAKHHGGEFVLRIEDTDQNRYVEDAESDITKSIQWAGLDYSEGPDRPGAFGPYRQSERSAIYKQYADQLIENDYAYFAFDTTEEIEEMRSRLEKSGNPSPKYDAITRMSMKNSLTLPKDEVERRLASGDPYVIRLKVPRRETVRFFDEIRGFVSFETQGLDDQVLMKSDGLPTYHLANVVDDHLMEITHVIRGEEWLSSAPKHILLYNYLGWEPPKMAHLPLIMSPAGGKLSKRNAESLGIPVNVRDYVTKQYEPQAVVNFLAFLGWNPGDNREVMSLDELVESFSLDRVVKSGSIFNFNKLTWYNEQYLRSRSEASILEQVKPDFEAAGCSISSQEFGETVIRLIKDRASLITDFVAEAGYFFNAPESYDEKTVAKAWKADSTPALIIEFAEILQSSADFSAEHLKHEAHSFLEAKGLGFGKLGLPLRLAITGKGAGPDLFEVIALIGKEETAKRIQKALETL
ncbi:glutamate--tRNA ligase [bacterium]|nr:MAG: glutamate--tRNA ligase [bacterium]